MKTVAIANSKGGCGKTTTSVNLAAALARKGRSVLIIDFDPQAHATLGLGHNPETLNKTIYHCLVDKQISISSIATDTYIEGLKLAPSNILLANAEFELAAVPGKGFLLAEQLKPVKHEYEICVIDCPPSLGLLTLNALIASTDVIIPVQMHYYGLESLKHLLETVEFIRERFSDCRIQTLGLLLTFVENSTSLTQEIEQQIRQYFGDFVFQTVIHRSIYLAEAPRAGQSILTYAPKSTGAADYTALAEELYNPKSQKKHRLTKEAHTLPLTDSARAKKFRPPAAIVSLAKIPRRAFHLRTAKRKVGLYLGLAILAAIMVSLIPATMVNYPPVIDATRQKFTPVPITLRTIDSNENELTYDVVECPATASKNVAVSQPNIADTQSETTAEDNLAPISLTGNDSELANASIALTEVNESPIANGQDVTTQQDKSVTIDVLRECSDEDNNSLTVAAVEQGINGAVSINEDSTLTYTPNANCYGTDTSMENVTVLATNNEPAITSLEPQTTTLTIVDGHDEKNQRTLSTKNETCVVQYRDGNCWETDPGLYTSYDFSDVSIPPGSVITSVSIYVQHFEQEQFTPGKLQWSIGTGWPSNPAIWVSIDAPVHQGEQNKAIDGWNVTSFVNTVEKVNSLQLRVKNNDVIGKNKTLVDYIYAEVTWH